MPKEWSEGEDSDPPEIKNSRNKSLIEFRFMLEQAILRDEKSKEIALWGIPLLPSSGHEGTDSVLMKFLKAKHYKVGDALQSLRKTLKWRAEFRPEKCFESDISWFRSGTDNEGRPLCYSVLGEEFQRKLFNPRYEKNGYRDDLRWRIFCLEKGIQHLSFKPGGVDSFIQIFDLRNAPKLADGGEANLICKKMTSMILDHYPGIVYKNMIVNSPSMFSTLDAFIRKRSKNRIIFVKPSSVTQALLKFATIENIPVQYGGLKRDNDEEAEFTADDKVLEMDVKPFSTEYIRIPINETGVTVTWDLTVVGCEVTYREEFVPDDDRSYKILLLEKKLGGGDSSTRRNSFYIREPGKIIITIANGFCRRKKKTCFYRYNIRPPPCLISSSSDQTLVI